MFDVCKEVLYLQAIHDSNSIDPDSFLHHNYQSVHHRHFLDKSTGARKEADASDQGTSNAASTKHTATNVTANNEQSKQCSLSNNNDIIKVNNNNEINKVNNNKIIKVNNNNEMNKVNNNNENFISENNESEAALSREVHKM